MCTMAAQSTKVLSTLYLLSFIWLNTIKHTLQHKIATEKSLQQATKVFQATKMATNYIYLECFLILPTSFEYILDLTIWA